MKITSAPDRCRGILLLFSLIALIGLPERISAQSMPGAGDTAMPTPAKAQIASPPHLICSAADTAGTARFSMQVDSRTQWQPRGGTVYFKIKGDGLRADTVRLVACFRWNHLKDAPWYAADAVRDYGQQPDPSDTLSFKAIVPSELPPRPEWWSRFSGNVEGDYSWLQIVPTADFRVVGFADDSLPIVVTQSFGVTSTTSAFWTATLVILFMGLALYRLSALRRVHTSGGFLLTLIATRAGYASLSQFQIMLWTFLIGGGAVYVMAMSGTLIDIPTGALALLGIAGVATVGSKLQSHQEESNSGDIAAPSKVEGLCVTLETDSEIGLSWYAPATGGPVWRYIVQYRQAGANDWITGSASIELPVFRIIKLFPGDWEVQVRAANAAGPGSFSDRLKLSLAPAVAPISQLPPVSGFRLGDTVQEHAVSLLWLPSAGAMGYELKYRRHQSDEEWQVVDDIQDAKASIENLIPATDYDIAIAAKDKTSLGPFTYLSIHTSPRTRVPQWSDLVVKGDGAREIDVTRVQMLFFTVVSALFVALKIITTSIIPDIPEGFYLLMGISNGVYLTAKYIPD